MFISLLFVVSIDQLIPSWNRIFGNPPQPNTVVLRHSTWLLPTWSRSSLSVVNLGVNMPTSLLFDFSIQHSLLLLSYTRQLASIRHQTYRLDSRGAQFGVDGNGLDVGILPAVPRRCESSPLDPHHLSPYHYLSASLSITRSIHPSSFINVPLNAHPSLLSTLSSPSSKPSLTVDHPSSKIVHQQSLVICLSVSDSPILELLVVVHISHRHTPTSTSACHPRQSTSLLYHQLSNSNPALFPLSPHSPSFYAPCSHHYISSRRLLCLLWPQWIVVAQERVPCLSISSTDASLHAIEIALDEDSRLTSGPS
jgi:hypothetical protein